MKIEPLQPQDASAVKGQSIKRRAPKQFLHDDVLQKTRQFVVEGGLPQGARIPEKLLCERFGVSRTPLREALKVLAAEGLVELTPNKGARIPKLDETALAELFEVMGGLEALAARLACARMTDTQYAEIEALHHQMYGCYIRRDLSGYFAANQAIHEGIVIAAENQRLLELYHATAAKLRRARYAANLDVQTDRWAQAMREHELILDALRRRAVHEVGEIFIMHLFNKHRAAAQVAAQDTETDASGPSEVA